jgi:hypothetical protein
MASGPKTRARVLTVEHPGFVKSLRAVNARKFSDMKRKRDEMPPPQFEGANSPLAVFETTESPKMKSEKELRKDYRSPPGFSRPSPKPRPKPAVVSGKNETVVPKMPRGGGETVVYKTPEKREKAVIPKPKLRPSAPPAKKAKKQSFDEAFASARKSKKKVFVFEGKKFSTKIK